MDSSHPHHRCFNALHNDAHRMSPKNPIKLAETAGVAVDLIGSFAGRGFSRDIKTREHGASAPEV
jgi:hypothetical protein